MVPQGIESVNGSSVNMGCTSPLVNSGGVMICNMSQSYLVDGCSPAIDTSTSDWASQLVTVRKTQTDEIQFDHVLLTFGFDTAVTLTGIELDLFLCPELNTYAPFITVYANRKRDFNITLPLISLPFRNYPRQGDVLPHSCDSLLTIAFDVGDSLASDSFLTWHILVHGFNSSIDWVRVGEVQFLGTDVNSGMVHLLTLACGVEGYCGLCECVCVCVCVSVCVCMHTQAVEKSRFHSLFPRISSLWYYCTK